MKESLENKLVSMVERFEEVGHLLSDAGVPDNFMWACDYPHPDSTWPHSQAAIERALGALGPQVIEKITGENCRKLYGLS